MTGQDVFDFVADERNVQLLVKERREFAQFILRAVMQPFLFVFVFLYVFPHIGAGIHGPGRASFGTILLPGLVAVAVLFQGIQAVALPLVNEINRTREIEDRVMALLPTNLVAFEKILFGGTQSALAALIVFPMVLAFPNSHVHTQINPALLVAEIIVACLAGGLARRVAQLRPLGVVKG